MHAFGPESLLCLVRAIAPTAGLAIGCVLLVWITTRGTIARTALQRILKTPALLVPAAMQTTGLLAVWCGLAGWPVHENPLGLGIGGFDRDSDRWHLACWLGVLLVAGAVAGQVGLLEAEERGRRPDGTAMLRGIKRHFVTFAIAKLLLGAGAHLLTIWIVPRDAWLIAFVVPSLFIAPIIGTASAHPGRPLRALRDALELAYGNIFVVGWPLIAQTALLVGTAILLHRLDAGFVPPALLATSSSVLSYNQFAFLTAPGGLAMHVIATATVVFGSAVFITAHWLGVRHGYHAVRPEPEPAA